MTTLGLRVDVDTFRGTRDGVPRLLDLLAAHAVKATFFFSLGPDNMGRHIRRLLRPRFLVKMIRSRAASLYGWETLLAGTLGPGRRIGAELGHVLRATDEAGHEVGLHAWDHYRWQTAATKMSVGALRRELGLGVAAFGDVFGRRPDCSAAAGWICNDGVLEAKEAFGFRYNSDCRGRSVFVPVVDGRRLAPQIPTTLPTYDELAGRDGFTSDTYNRRLLDSLQEDALNVLTVHAEVEGIVCAGLFDQFLTACKEQGIGLVPLKNLLGDVPRQEQDTIVQAAVAGRDGSVAWQRSVLTR